MQGEGWPYYEDWGPKAWCPFKSAGNYFDDTSRMAVAKQVVLVTGPDPKYEGQSLIHSMNFSWGSRDHTWRWRRCGPQDAISAQGRDTGHDHIVFPGTIRIRDDMTILVEGLAREYEGYRFPTDPVRGWWYQKYLPADNWEVPAPEYCEKDQMPPVGYTHPWRFITDRNLMLADNFSHFGTYDSVNSRSQFCTISGPYVRELGRSLSPEEFADLFPEDTQWEDIEDRLRPDSLFEPRITLKIAKRLLPVPFGGRQFGLIAMHWDKRNDDLAPLYEAGSPIVLQSKGPHQDGAPSRIEISISKHYRKWSPPVVQKAEIDVDMQGRKIIISFQSILKLEHRSDSLDRGKVRRVPRRQGPDRSIWRVKMYAFDKEGKPVLLFNKDTSEFTDAGDYTFKHEWLDTQNDANGKPLGWDNLVTNYLSPQGRIDSALSIVFEDLVGHVATPESVIFVPRSRISQRPGRSLP
ncbi:MAG: hypothetical protein C4582_03540 [Desulfobacteraceae bacterium]|jgi:hypothetical protein|nr:MAG: hypothetical protein C4582_03540 [Desulfobacteraceae bacterium]